MTEHRITLTREGYTIITTDPATVAYYLQDQTSKGAIVEVAA